MSDGSHEDLGSAASLLEALADAPGLDARGPLVPGTVVAGKYRVERAIGQGGMGVVYLARDARLDRPLALKLGMQVGERALARMEREGQALAKLSHPNVVTIYEVGEHEGRLFVAMEYVAGGTARAWCAGKSPREIVALYAAAGDGLAAAHAAGIVHRDFKPDNVLVGKDGRPRVADFGLARGRDDDDEDPRRAVGTPAYMAPEQRAGGEIDERADQYSFARTLWEALTGTRPDGSADSTVTVTHTTMNGERAPASPRLAGDARAMPGHVAAALTRALAESPAERWPSLAALLAELRRDPHARRKRMAIVGLAAFAAASAVAIPFLVRRGAEDPCGGGGARLAAVWNGERAAAIEKALGPKTAATVRPELDAFGERWVAAERAACRAAQVEKTRSEVQAAKEMVCLHRARSRLDAIVQQLARGGGDVVAHATEQLVLLPDLRTCGDLDALATQQPPPMDATARVQLDALMFELGAAEAAARLAKPRDLRAIDELLARARALGWPPLIAEAEYQRAVVLDHRGNADEAVAAYREAANAALAAGYNELAAYALADLAWRLASSGRGEDARREIATAESLLARSGGNRTFEVRLLGAKQMIAQTEGRGADALAIARELVEVSRAAFHDPVNDVANDMTIAEAELSAGELEAALRDAQTGLAKTEKLLGADHPRLVGFLRVAGQAELRLGRIADADRDSARALELAEKWHGPDDAIVGLMLVDRISLAHARGDVESIRTLSQRALKILERADPHGDMYGGLLLDLGVAAALGGELDVAGGYADRALAVFEGLGNPNNPALVSVLLLHGYVARERRDYAESERHLRRAVGIAERGRPSEAANAKLELSYTLVKAKRAADAVALLVPIAGDALEPKVRAELHQGRAAALWAAGDKAAARAEAQAALAAWTALGETFGPQRAQTEAWIAAHR